MFVKNEIFANSHTRFQYAHSVPIQVWERACLTNRTLGSNTSLGTTLPQQRGLQTSVQQKQKRYCIFPAHTMYKRKATRRSPNHHAGTRLLAQRSKPQQTAIDDDTSLTTNWPQQYGIQRSVQQKTKTYYIFPAHTSVQTLSESSFPQQPCWNKTGGAAQQASTVLFS